MIGWNGEAESVDLKHIYDTTIKYLENSMDNRLVDSVRHEHFHWHFERLHSVSVLIIQSVKTVEQHSIFYVHRTVNARQTL